MVPLNVRGLHVKRLTVIPVGSAITVAARAMAVTVVVAVKLQRKILALGEALLQRPVVRFDDVAGVDALFQGAEERHPTGRVKPPGRRLDDHELVRRLRDALRQPDQKGLRERPRVLVVRLEEPMFIPTVSNFLLIYI